MRSAVAMSSSEVEGFLRANHVMRLATLRASGGPHIVSMWYGMLGDRLVFSSYGRAQKIVNLRGDPRVACQVEEGEHPSEVRGVCIEGVGTVLEDPEAVAEVVHVVSLQALGTAPTEASLVAMGLAKRVAVSIEVRRIASWDHRKLAGGGYMRGVVPGEGAATGSTRAEGVPS